MKTKRKITKPKIEVSTLKNFTCPLCHKMRSECIAVTKILRHDKKGIKCESTQFCKQCQKAWNIKVPS